MHIELERVSKQFSGREVLKDISLTVKRGEFAMLLGPSGAGKTVLLSLVAGLEQPDEGRVIIGGRDMARVAPERRPVTMVFQRHALFPHLTVFDNIAFSLRARRQPYRAVRDRVAELLALAGLEAYAQAKPDVLSGGQCQRVAFARALASDAEVVLFDEPFSSLDNGLKAGLMAELKRLHGIKTFTALYVTHNLDEALTLGDRVFLMKEGRIARSCLPSELCGGGEPDEAEASGGCPSALGRALRAPVFALA